MVETLRADSSKFLRAKQKAEQRCRAKEGHMETLEKTVGFSRKELAAEKVHVAEIQNRSRV